LIQFSVHAISNVTLTIQVIEVLDSSFVKQPEKCGYGVVPELYRKGPRNLRGTPLEELQRSPSFSAGYIPPMMY